MKQTDALSDRQHVSKHSSILSLKQAFPQELYYIQTAICCLKTTQFFHKYNPMKLEHSSNRISY